MRAIAIDFETANEARASPCSVGLAWIEDGVVTRTAYRLIRPPAMRFAPGNVRVHGIRPADVADAPDFPAVFAPFWPELSSTLLLAHNAAFDMGVLSATAALYGLPPPRLAYACTRLVGQRSWPEEPSHGLAALARKVGVRFRHHHALEDAVACARVALAAARAAGTTRVSVLLDRLSIAPRRTDDAPAGGGPPRPAASRPRFVEGEGPRPLVFTVAGSRGGHYEVRGAFSRGGFRMTCSCEAGLHRRRCRHVTGLLDGEVTDLLSENLHDLAKLGAVIQALGYDTIEPSVRSGRVTSASQAAVSGSTSPDSAAPTPS